MKKVSAFFLIGCIAIGNTFAQRILAGEINYQHISDLTFLYSIQTISFGTAANAIDIDFGDGSSSTVTIESEPLENNYYNNSYSVYHTFAGPGQYITRVKCGYQMPGVVNSLLSLNDPFYLYCKINIADPLTLGYNSSPVFLMGLNDVEENDGVYSFSLNAYDPDGDILKFELSTYGMYEGYDDICYIPGASNYIGIDSVNGDFLWDQPLAFGRYFFAVKIYEYRNDVFLGWTMRTYMIDHYDQDAAHDILIYPDPGSGLITINFGQNYFDRFGLNLYSITGQKIRSFNYERPNAPLETFDVSDLPPGSYLLNLMIAPKPLTWIYLKPANKL